MTKKILPWTLESEGEEIDFTVLTIRERKFKDPRNGSILPRVHIRTPDWVNVIARTADSKIVMVRQFRFGIEGPTLELPGGLVDPNESTLHGALRELEEETGYTS